MPGAFVFRHQLIDDRLAFFDARRVGDDVVDADLIARQDRERSRFVDFGVVHHEETDAGVGVFGVVLGVGDVGAAVLRRGGAGGEDAHRYRCGQSERSLHAHHDCLSWIERTCIQ